MEVAVHNSPIAVILLFLSAEKGAAILYETEGNSLVKLHHLWQNSGGSCLVLLIAGRAANPNPRTDRGSWRCGVHAYGA